MAKGEPATAAVAASGADSDLSNEANMKLHVRLLLTLLLAVVGSLASGTKALAQTDPLPSWNDGPAKQAIVEFVHATTDQPSPQFAPPEARIATFDQDGTLGRVPDLHAGGLLLGPSAGRREGET
jgi:hypothetical protein